LTQFGINRLTLPPGAWSSQRHTESDEFIYVPGTSGRGHDLVDVVPIAFGAA
jgi:uncharacterized cupin superfamily protein